MRTESGFAQLRLPEDEGLGDIVVAKLHAPLHRLCGQNAIWQPSEVPGTDVAEVWHREQG